MNLPKAFVTGDLTELKTRLDAAGGLDFADYRRASSQTRYAMLAVASVAVGDMSRWAVIGWNGSGCTAENRIYWDDYVAAGRESSRGTLFVPTLPSIPACEAAIVIGAHAECGYYRTAPDTGELAQIVEDLMNSSPNVDGVVVVESSPSEAVAVAIRRGKVLPRGFTSLKDVC